MRNYDILVLFNINGYVCELQINIAEILIIKEGLGHKQYELIRKFNDDLLDAAMRDNTGDVQTALSGKADPNAPRDMYDLTPLHYSAHHGNADIVNMLALLQRQRGALRGRGDMRPRGAPEICGNGVDEFGLASYYYVFGLLD